jgi:hypothetical protein
MKHLFLTLILSLCFVSSINAQEMHRKLGASFQAGASFKTARFFGRFGSDGTTIKPGITVGCNLRYRLSPKSSLQFSGNLILDRFTILNHVEGRSSYRRAGWPDTTYSIREYGDVELELLSWHGALSYRYTLNHRWGFSLGIRLGEVLQEEGNFTVRTVEQYRRVENENTLISAFDVVRPDGLYWITNTKYEGGLQSNIYCQLNRRLQLMASFDTPIPFVKYFGYTFSRYKVSIAHRLF